MGKYLIKDFEALSGIKAHTIRIWEQRYGILKPERTSTNIRRYNDDELKLLLNISTLNRNGYKISKVAQMKRSEIEEKVRDITATNFDFPNQITALTAAMVDMNEMEFERVLNVNIVQLGFESTVENIVFPFLQQIGVMWQTGSVNAAQEHFISNLIRQKLIVNIDKMKERYSDFTAKSLLFLPEDEFHEISLLYFDYQLRKHHHHTMYLGQNVPLKDITAVNEIFRPQYVFTIFTQRPTEKTIANYVAALSKIFPKTPVYVTGFRALYTRKVKWPSNFHLLHNSGEIRLLLKQELDFSLAPAQKN
ncbi:MAG: MerR family transcriptional regulator [Chitinophagales bacterium]|nr:MerR family transcriptional regulator [Bacteroidota bacterium]MBX7139654.1 MerR family transcriptional regulator [Chitinophagales bacterium]